MILGLLAGTILSSTTPPPATGDPYWAHVAFLIDASGQGDGTGYVADESRIGGAISYGGNAQITSQEFVMDGSGDFIQTNAGVSRPLYIPGSRFTLEFWGAKFNSAAGTQTLCGVWNASGSTRCWSLTYVSGTGLRFECSPDGATTTTGSVAFTPTVGTAYDIAVTWDGATIRFYVNGAYLGSFAYAGRFFGNPNYSFRIGMRRVSSADTNYWNGKFKAFRFTKGIDRAEGNTATWTDRDLLPLYKNQGGTFNDPQWDKVLMLVTVEGGTIRDAGPYDWPINLAGNVAVDSVNQPFAGQDAITFDGSGDYIVIRHDPLLALATKDYTLELHARHTNITPGTNADKTYMAKYIASTNNREWGLQLDVGASPDALRTFTGNSGGLSYSTNWSPALNTYYHIASIRNGNDKMHFIDGAQIGATQTNTNDFTPTSTTAAFAIGQLGAGDANFFVGQMAEIRITAGVSRYTAGFAKPTAAFPRG